MFVSFVSPAFLKFWRPTPFYPQTLGLGHPWLATGAAETCRTDLLALRQPWQVNGNKNHFPERATILQLPPA